MGVEDCCVDGDLQRFLDILLEPDGLKCAWRSVYESNQKGVGTSFAVGDKNKPCFYCSGYDFDAPCYHPEGNGRL